MKHTTDKEVNALPEYPKDILRTSDFNKLKAEKEKLVQDVKVLREALRGLIVHLEWREDFVIEDAEEGNINCYTVATEALNQTK